MKLKGNGYFNVGDLSLDKIIQSLANVSTMATTPSDINIPDGSNPLLYLMNVVSGPFGLMKRVATLENG